MTRHVTFRADGPPDAPDPVPSSQHLPKWFRALDLSVDSLPIPGDKTARLCMPLNDAMKLGWLLRAPCDIHLRTTDDGVRASAEREGAVTTVDVDQSNRTRNSAFLLPECLVSTSWGVETPPGYATLITQPLNRDELRFTVPGMLVPTDEYDGSIDVPIHVEQEEVTIEAGDPIAHVIPVAREDLATETAARPFEHGSAVDSMLRKTLRASNRRKDVYRKEAWVPKPSPRIVEDPEDVEPAAERPEEPAPETTEGAGRRDDDRITNDGTLSYYCSADQYDDLPAPVPAVEYVPDWYDDRLRSIEGIDDDQPTSEWIQAATRVGAIIPLPARTTVRRTGGARPLEVTVEGDSGMSHNVQYAEKMGDAHPLASVVNFTSKWLVRPPPGHSVLVCSPFAHLQRYYRSYAGLGDFDRYAATANAPGLFTDRADERTFPARTPVAQHLPIDRGSIIAVATIER